MGHGQEGRHTPAGEVSSSALYSTH